MLAADGDAPSEARTERLRYLGNGVSGRATVRAVERGGNVAADVDATAC